MTNKIKVTIVFTSLLACAAICSFPFITARITGQFCLDIMSGQVPYVAEERYFNILFTAVENEDFETVAQLVDSEVALEDLKTLRPIISTNYELIWGDDLAGVYERSFRFDNGNQVFLNYYGSWKECPDFNVTDEEVREFITLAFIELEENR